LKIHITVRATPTKNMTSSSSRSAYLEFSQLSDSVLSQLFKKPANREKITKALWKYASKEYDDAVYLLYETFAEYLVSTKLEDVVESLKQQQLGWDQSTFQKYAVQQQEYDQFIVQPPELEEGVIQCKCGSKKTFSFSKQTRRADESATVFVRCVECGNSFRI